MSYLDLFMSGNPMITASGGDAEPAATVLGVPFDSTHSYRPGCRFGPDSIRDAFNNIEAFHPGLGADLEQARIEDLGNVRHTVDVSEMIDMVRKITAELAPRGRQVIIMGGEHSLTYGAYTGLPEGTGYVVFDAHYDLRDEFADARLGHASYLRRIAEERDPGSILHVGARAFASEELEFLRESGIRTVTDGDVREGRGPGIIREHLSAFDSVYASVDLDVLDPAFAPGVGNPEAVGITPRELFGMIHALGDTDVRCADIVELNPYHDNGATSSLAAKVMSTFIAMSVSRGGGGGGGGGGGDGRTGDAGHAA